MAVFAAIGAVKLVQNSPGCAGFIFSRGDPVEVSLDQVMTTLASGQTCI